MTPAAKSLLLLFLSLANPCSAVPWTILVTGSAETLGQGGGAATLTLDSDTGALALASTSQLGSGGVGGWTSAKPGAPDALPTLLFSTRRAGGSVQSISVNTTGGMAPLGTPQLTGGADPEHVQFLPPRWVLTANYGSGLVGIQPVAANGAVGPPLKPVQVGANAHEVAFDPANVTRVFVPCLGADHVAQVGSSGDGKLVVGNLCLCVHIPLHYSACCINTRSSSSTATPAH